MIELELGGDAVGPVAVVTTTIPDLAPEDLLNGSIYQPGSGCDHCCFHYRYYIPGNYGRGRGRGGVGVRRRAAASSDHDQCCQNHNRSSDSREICQFHPRLARSPKLHSGPIIASTTPSLRYPIASTCPPRQT